MMLKELTVICCAYNAQNTIHATINSVLNNLNQGMELIVVNDGSNDYTRDIVLEFKHPNIMLIDNEKNMGIGYSRNIAMDNVQTNYFGFLDADDHVSTTYFAHLIKRINKNPNLDVLLSNQYVEKIYKKRTIRNSIDIPEKWLNNLLPLDILVGDINKHAYVDTPLMPLIICKTKFINSNNIRCSPYRTAENYSFIWHTIKANAQFMVTEELGYFYNKCHNPNALTQSTDIIRLDFLQCYSEILPSIRKTKKENYINKVTRQIIELIDSHIKKIYPSNVMNELYRRASILVKSFSEEEFDFTYSTVNNHRKELLMKLKHME